MDLWKRRGWVKVSGMLIAIGARKWLVGWIRTMAFCFTTLRSREPSGPGKRVANVDWELYGDGEGGGSDPVLSSQIMALVDQLS